MKREPFFKTEADLCAAFIAWAKRDGWTAYAETAGWDILLVAGDGTQIGVQAKLRLNIDVLDQAVQGDGWNSATGPDFRAILVPMAKARDLCKALGITVIHWTGRLGSRPHFQPDLPEQRAPYYRLPDWHYANHEERCELPEYIPDVPAGVAAPIQLTKWKVAALKVCAALQLRGHVTRADFRNYGIDPRRWINENDWLQPGVEPGQFVRGQALNFDKQHPNVYQQVLADVAKELRVQFSSEVTA